MTLAGNLAPELRAMLKGMTDLDKRAKDTTKSIERWSGPLTRAAAEMAKLVKEVGAAHRALGNVDRDIKGWGSATAKPVSEMKTLRSEVQGVSRATSGVTRSIGSWAGAIQRATNAVHGLQAAASRVHMPAVPTAYGGGRGGGTGVGQGARRGRGGRGGHGGRHGAFHHEGSSLAGLVGVTGGVHMMKDVVETGVDMRHIELGMRQTGATPEQIEHARKVAYEGSKAYPNLSPVEIFEHVNDLRGILGDIDKAVHEAPDLLPEFSALKAKAGNHGAKNAVNEIYTAVKSAETANEITSEGVKKHANSLMRLAFWYGDKLNPSNYFTAQKNGGQMLNLTSDRFRYGAFAALTQEIGQRAGTQFGTFAAKGVAGLRMLGSGLTEADKYGLLQPQTVTWNKKHTLVQPGAQFSDVGPDGKNYDRAKDPDLWLYNNIIPKLKKGGVDVDNKAELLRTLGRIFTDKNAYGFLFELAQQKSKIEKDYAGFERTGGDTSAYRKEDPYAAMQGTKAQAGAVSAALTESSIPGLVENLSRVNAALGGLASTLEKNPNAAQGAFGVGAMAVGGLAAAGVTALTLAAVGTLSLPALAVGTIAALTIGALTLPWSAIAKATGAEGVARKIPDIVNDQAYFERANDWTKKAAGPASGAAVPGDAFGGVRRTQEIYRQLNSDVAAAAGPTKEMAGGIAEAKSAASGAGGVFSSAAAGLSALVAAARAAGANPAVAGHAGPPAARQPGGAPALDPNIKRGASYAPVSSTRYAGGPGDVYLDGRKVGKHVERTLVAEHATRNGVGGFDSTTMKTPVGWPGAVLA